MIARSRINKAARSKRAGIYLSDLSVGVATIENEQRGGRLI